MSVCIDTSFLRHPAWSDNAPGETDFSFYEKCARVSLRMSGAAISEQNVADETSRLLDSAYASANDRNRQTGYLHDGEPSDRMIKEAMRSDLLFRIDHYDPAQNGGRMLAFFVTPETRVALEEYGEARHAAMMRPSYFEL